MPRFFVLSAFCGALFFSPSASQAACFESIGCTDKMAISEADLGTLSCDRLWTVRNTIFHEHGYCFQTARGREAFSNDGCFTSNAGELTLNRFERSNVAAVQRTERMLGCQ